jgi:hypothetical protein
MRAVTGYGANKSGIPLRADLPLHDMTGGNYWMPDVILYQNDRGLLRLGGGLTSLQREAILAGKLRAQQQLELAASLNVSGNTLKVVNLTGHKLISGYPEGRRMWLNIKWYDANNALLREDGEYGVVANVGGAAVKSLVNPYDTNTRVYEAHYGMTQEWAEQLLALHPAELPLSFDRVTGEVSYTLGQLAAQATGTYHETFHFVLNNTVVKDNRIPPYGMQYEEARKRNALPVPATQYGAPTGTAEFKYWDEFTLNPPAGAAYADIKLMYQPTSWEYVQFLYAANTRQNAFLADEGVNLLNAWLATGQAEPYVMASATWGSAPPPPCATPGTPQTLTAAAAKKAVTLSWKAGSPAPTGGYRIYYDQSGKLQFAAASGPPCSRTRTVASPAALPTPTSSRPGPTATATACSTPASIRKAPSATRRAPPPARSSQPALEARGASQARTRACRPLNPSAISPSASIARAASRRLQIDDNVRHASPNRSACRQAIACRVRASTRLIRQQPSRAAGGQGAGSPCSADSTRPNWAVPSIRRRDAARARLTRRARGSLRAAYLARWRAWRRARPPRPRRRSGARRDPSSAAARRARGRAPARSTARWCPPR